MDFVEFPSTHLRSSKMTDHEVSSARGIGVYLISTLTNRKAV